MFDPASRVRRSTKTRPRHSSTKRRFNLVLEFMVSIRTFIAFVAAFLSQQACAAPPSMVKSARRSGHSVRKPPMGFSSWNHFHMGVTAPLLLDVADSFKETGLHEAGYIYINTDDGWLDFNRTGPALKLHPSSHFTNDTLESLVSALHAKEFKFGIYLAAGFTTCGRRAGSLYHERDDAAQIAAAGVDYLKCAYRSELLQFSIVAERSCGSAVACVQTTTVARQTFSLMRSILS